MATPTSKVFDQTNSNYSSSPEYNQVFLKSIQQFLNDKLNMWGHVFLNDVYDALGFARSQAGTRLGWYKSCSNVYIDFNPTVNDDGSILLEFNTTGEIVTKLPEF